MKYIFVINPIAGNDNKKKLFSRIKSTFRLIEDEMILEETKCKGDAKDIASRYAQMYGKDCVIVSCGGDGTVHEIANGLAHTDTPMLILPLGTGNDFAKKIGTHVIGTIHRSNLIQDAELDAKTVIEKYPESQEAQEYRDLASSIMSNENTSIPEPMNDEEFEAFFKSYL